jgi:hypothetical protein
MIRNEIQYKILIITTFLIFRTNFIMIMVIFKYDDDLGILEFSFEN